MSEKTNPCVQIARLRACEAGVSIFHWLRTIDTPSAIALRLDCLALAINPEMIGNPSVAQLASQYGVSRQWVEQLRDEAKILLKSR